MEAYSGQSHPGLLDHLSIASVDDFSQGFSIFAQEIWSIFGWDHYMTHVAVSQCVFLANRGMAEGFVSSTETAYDANLL